MIHKDSLIKISRINVLLLLKKMIILSISILFLSWGNNLENEVVIKENSRMEKIFTQIKNIQNSDTLVVSTAKVIVLVPSQKEGDSLIKLWGENKFYDIAYDENRKLSRVYGKLDETNTPYEASDTGIIYIEKTNRILKKSDFPYSWGALTIKKDGSYEFKNPIDFLLSLE